MRRLIRVLAVAATSLLTAGGILLGTPASAVDATVDMPALPQPGAHDERGTIAPDGKGKVPPYRPEGPTLLVCKTDKADFDQRIAGFPTDLRTTNLALWTECQKTGYRNLQEAVNNVKQPGMTIKVLPGVYLEEPSLATPSAACANLSAPRAALGYQVLSWEQQVECPHNQNLVAILDKKDLQVEGTGAKPEDVVVDAQYRKLNAVRADRASGIYLRNFTAQRTTFNAVYIMESDGFVIDRMVGRWNDEYGFLTFADDHGLYTDCEAYGNGDSGIYPGAASNINANKGHAVDRYAIEIRRCTSHHNLLGYSGTAGNSVWAHDNVFTSNTAGVATDSVFPNHPGLPQNHALFERNVIGDNNEEYYHYARDGTCRKPYEQRGYEQGVVCPAAGVPVGTGIINPGGNYNVWRANWIYNNAYAGFVTSWAPGFVRNDRSVRAQFDTSHHNRYYANQMGVKPDGAKAPNGMDFWWDGQGVGSCWQRPSADGAEPRVLPQCRADDMPARFGTARYVAEPAKVFKLYVCSDYDQASQRIPSDCDWFGARGLQRIEVKYALGEAILLGLVLVVVRRRVLRGSGLGFFGMAVALAGLVVGVYGTVWETTLFTGIGLGLLGMGWLFYGVALRRRGRSGLAWLTITLALFALLGGVDRSLLMLPWIPVPPSLVRILLEVIWVPAAVVAAVRGRVLAGTRNRRPARDPLERFTAALRR
jgi:hypothetical protein